MEWIKKNWPIILVAFVVALIRSVAFDKISGNACWNVKNIPAGLSWRQQKEFCQCVRRTGDYYITLEAVKRISTGEGKPDDFKRYDKLFNVSCEENALKVSKYFW